MSRPPAPFAHATVVDGGYSSCEPSDSATPQAAVMPDGSLVMLSPSNPFGAAIAKARLVEPQDLGVNDAAFEQFYRPALELERMARVVRILSLFDLVFSLMHAFAAMSPAALVALMSYSGYIGARTFRRDLTRIYLTYLVLFALARVVLSARLFAAEASGDPAMAGAASHNVAISTAVAAGVQILIATFVWRFYSLLPTSLAQARLLQLVSERTMSMPV